jgi:hypothetical protein
MLIRGRVHNVANPVSRGGMGRKDYDHLTLLWVSRCENSISLRFERFVILSLTNFAVLRYSQCEILMFGDSVIMGHA